MKSKLALHGGSKVRTKPFPVHPVMGPAEKKGVLEVLKTGKLSGFVAKAGDFFLGGPKVKAFEKLCTDYFKVPYAMAVNSATAGLHCALAAAHIGPGDEVIVPPYTMSASASAVLMCNAVPRFVDIQEDIYCLDPEKFEKAITHRTKAVVAVHLFGHPARMDEILAIAKRRNLFVVEDCAQAPGAKYKGKFAGTMGDAGVFSLNQHKTITTGEGGWVLTRREDVALKVRLIRNHGEAVVEDLHCQDIANTLGWNYRMTELEAAVAIGQFQKLDKLTKHRQMLADYLSKNLKAIDGLTLPVTLPKCVHTWFVYPIQYDKKKTGLSRELFIKAVNAEGIPFGQGYVKPLYLAPMYQREICSGNSGWPFTSIPEGERPKYRRGLCPVTERFHEKTLIHTNLCYWPVTLRDMKDVVTAVKKVLANAPSLRASHVFFAKQSRFKNGIASGPADPRNDKKVRV